MQEYIQVYTAIDSKEAAQKIALAIVSQRLAACCWVSGPITSTYWWEDKVEQAEEWVCTMKTRKALFNKLEQAIKAAHTYDVPEIVATPIVAGNQSYLEWIEHETSGTSI